MISVLREGDLAAGRYRLVRPIGEGGMASVWWAHDETSGRDVALKVAVTRSNPEKVARFLREANVIRRFSHPNIVGVLDAGELPNHGGLYLAMELLRGGAFAERVEAGDPLPAAEVLGVLIGVCKGLEAAHASGVVHRDIKPENIFLAIDERGAVVPKILDFGVSTSGDRMQRRAISIDGQVIGTPAYMSPEQASGRIDITPAADLWAIGVVMYEALTGKLPFFGKSTAAILEAIVRDGPADVPGWVDDDLAAIIRRCTRKEPSKRYASATALRVDLERALARIRARDRDAHAEGAGGSMPPPPPSVPIVPSPPTSRPPRAQRQALARPKSPLLIAPFALALCLFALLAYPRKHKAPPVRFAEKGVARAAGVIALRLRKAAAAAADPRK